MSWIDVKDRLPEFGKDVMVKDKFGNTARGHYSDIYVPHRNYWCVYSPKILDSNVTHWKEEENGD